MEQPPSPDRKRQRLEGQASPSSVSPHHGVASPSSSAHAHHGEVYSPSSDADLLGEVSSSSVGARPQGEASSEAAPPPDTASGEAAPPPGEATSAAAPPPIEACPISCAPPPIKASSAAAKPEPELRWTQMLHPADRIRNRILIAEALYVNFDGAPFDEVLTTAAVVEQVCFEDATNGLEYLRMVCGYSGRRLLPHEVSKDVPKMNLQEGEEPLSANTFQDLQRQLKAKGPSPADISEYIPQYINEVEPLPADISEDLQRKQKGREHQPAYTTEELQRLIPLPVDTSEELQRQRKGKDPLPADTYEDFQRQQKGKEPLPEDTSEELQRQRKGKDPLHADTFEDTMRRRNQKETLPAYMSEDLLGHEKIKDPLPADTFEDIMRRRNQKETLPAYMSEDLLVYKKIKESLRAEILENFLHRHRVIVGCLRNLMLLFNMREPRSISWLSQYVDRLHTLRASNELTISLDAMTTYIQSVQTRSGKDVLSHAVQIALLELTYQAAIEYIMEKFSGHIKNECYCMKRVRGDVETGRKLQQQPQQQQQQHEKLLGPVQTASSLALDDALLAEFRYWLLLEQEQRS